MEQYTGGYGHLPLESQRHKTAGHVSRPLA